MAGKIQKEIKQTKPPANLAEEAFLNIQRTADAMLNEVAAALKPAGLTPTQYNVLRILRGAHPQGVKCGQVAERMITRDPDITRLMDRMEARGLVTRVRSDQDRRQVTTSITSQGLRILKDLDEPIANLHRLQLSRLGSEDLRRLIELLERAREASA